MSLFPELKCLLSWAVPELISVTEGDPVLACLQKVSILAPGRPRGKVLESHPTRLTHLRRMMNSWVLGKGGEEGGT